MKLRRLEELPELELTGFGPDDLAALRLEPADDPPPPEPEPARVEVTLVTDPATYARLAPRLDALVGEFDVTCHVMDRLSEPEA